MINAVTSALPQFGKIKRRFTQGLARHLTRVDARSARRSINATLFPK
jgi:hypothetical protein